MYMKNTCPNRNMWYPIQSNCCENPAHISIWVFFERKITKYVHIAVIRLVLFTEEHSKSENFYILPFCCFSFQTFPPETN